MNFQNHGHALPDNVVMFPGACRGRPPASPTREPVLHPASLRHHRAAALSGAEVNARLMILFGICVTSAAAVISAVHFLLG